MIVQGKEVFEGATLLATILDEDTGVYVDAVITVLEINDEDDICPFLFKAEGLNDARWFDIEEDDLISYETMENV